MLDKRFSKVQPPPSAAKSADDEEAIAYWPSAEARAAEQEKAMTEGKHWEALSYGKYATDKPYMPALKKRAHHDLDFFQDYCKQFLDGLASGKEDRQEVFDAFQKSKTEGTAAAKAKKELGEWFADYLVDNGYMPDDNPTLFKQLIASAFPPLLEGGIEKFTPDHFEIVMLRFLKLIRTHAYIDDHRGDPIRN